MSSENQESCASENPAVQCESSEGDVSIQCVQSSDFFIGKQTNFNGPVTIINCASVPEKKPLDESKHLQEEVRIRGEIRSQTAAMKMPEMAEEKENVGKDASQPAEAPTPQKQKIWFQKLTAFSLIPALVCIGFVATVAIALIVLFIRFSTGELVTDKNATHPFYSKQDWGGKPPTSTIEMKLPVPYVVVSHSVTTRCYLLKVCAHLIQNMQNYHLALDFADIGYNFLIDSSGNIYEGRGWTRRNVKGGFVNGRNIDICLIGDYSETVYPTEELMNGFKHLLQYGVENGKISKTYSLIAANSTYSTLSPGKNVYAVIKNWPHFDPDPKLHVKEYDE